MNWLAHLYLSPPTIHSRIGNLAADLIKGNDWPGLPTEAQSGIRLHRGIDRFTDQHPIFHKSKKRLTANGYLRGIAIDLLYDHFLTLHWSQFSNDPLEAFLDSFYREATANLHPYPVKIREFVESVVRSNRLAKYTSLEGVLHGMHHIDSRLSSRVRMRETVTPYFRSIKENYRGLESDFLQFFPQLIQFAQPQLSPLSQNGTTQLNR
ncbi:MAG: ACP phosphodiesterase [Verrucomicrobiota bacterium]